MALTEEQKKAAELAAAGKLVNRLKLLEDENTSLKEWRDKVAEPEIKRLQSLHKDLEGVELSKVFKNIDLVMQKQEQIIGQIRLSKGGIYVPGLGEEKTKFSIQRAARAIVNKEWGDAGFEKEVFDEAKKAMTKGTGHIIGVDSQGGFFVPDQAIAEVIGAIYANSILIALDGTGTNRVSVLNGLTGIPVTIPKFLGGMLAYWIGEQDRYVESAVKTGNVEMRPRKLGVLTRITDEMRRFASFGFEALMRQDMIRAAAALIDYTIVYGTGTNNMPRGVLKADGVKHYYAETHSETPPAGDALGGELGFDDLDNMRGVIEDQNIPLNSSWATIANPRYFRRLRQTKVTQYAGQLTGHSYLLGGPNFNDDAMRAVIGDFGKSTALPATNTAGQTEGLTPDDATDTNFGDVISGNWSEVIFGRWGGLEMAEDGGVGKGFPTDETYIKMRMYADVEFRSPESMIIATDVRMREAA